MTKAALLVNQLEESGMTDNLHHLAKVSVFFVYLICFVVHDKSLWQCVDGLIKVNCLRETT